MEDASTIFLPAFAANTYRGSPRERTFVVLDRDMAKVFPSSKAVNDALRILAEAGRRALRDNLKRALTANLKSWEQGSG
jgi:hypothetical protein